MLAGQPGGRWFQETFPHEKLHQTLREWAVAYPSLDAGNLILDVFSAGTAPVAPVTCCAVAEFIDEPLQEPRSHLQISGPDC